MMWLEGVSLFRVQVVHKPSGGMSLEPTNDAAKACANEVSKVLEDGEDQFVMVVPVAKHSGSMFGESHKDAFASALWKGATAGIAAFVEALHEHGRVKVGDKFTHEYCTGFFEIVDVESPDAVPKNRRRMAFFQSGTPMTFAAVEDLENEAGGWKRYIEPAKCEHVNECPCVCPCEPGCYCKTRTCAIGNRGAR